MNDNNKEVQGSPIVITNNRQVRGLPGGDFRLETRTENTEFGIEVLREVNPDPTKSSVGIKVVIDNPVRG